MDMPFQIRQWIGCGGASDHFPIFIEFKFGPWQPPNPLKLNKIWLKDESFKTLVQSGWIPFSAISTCSVAHQFADNIKHLKDAIKDWSVAKRLREDSE